MTGVQTCALPIYVENKTMHIKILNNRYYTDNKRYGGVLIKPQLWSSLYVKLVNNSIVTMSAWAEL